MSEEQKDHFNLGCGGLSLLIGLLLLSLAWFGPPLEMGWQGLGVYFSSDLIYTTGTIIRLDRTSVRDRNTMSRLPVMTPVVQFPLGKGTFVFRGLGGGKTSYTIGDKVPIAYRKSDPESAYIRTSEQQFAIPLVMIVFASPFLLIGFRLAYLIVRDRRRR